MTLGDFQQWFSATPEAFMAYALLHIHIHLRFKRLERLPTNAREIARSTKEGKKR